MRDSNITDNRPIDNLLVLYKDISLLNMTKSISNKIYAKASEYKPSVKPPPGDKTCGLDPDICFYDIEDGDETEKVEEAEILVIYDSSLAAYKQNLFKRQFPYIDMFDHEGPWLLTLCSI